MISLLRRVARATSIVCGLLVAAPRVGALPPGGSEPGRAVLFDETHAGEIWALAETYKAGFDVDGARIVPYLGAHAPRNYPLRLSLRDVRVGSRTLPLAAARPWRQGSTVELQRGALVELFRLEPTGLEHAFRFDELEGEGDLVLRVELSGELQPFACADGLEFHGPHGGLRYGAAVAIDARGRRAEAPMTLVGETLEIRVGADFLARAARPILVDPLIRSFTVAETPEDEGRPDVAHDLSLDRSVVVWERKFSDTDYDVLGVMLDGLGDVVQQFVVDASQEVRRAPSIAGVDSIDHMMVAMAQHPTRSTTGVQALQLTASGVSLGPFVPDRYVSVTDGSHDLGGGSGAAGLPRYCLVASGSSCLGCPDVWMRILAPDGTVTATQTIGDGDIVFATKGRVSKVAVGPMSSGLRRWAVVYEAGSTSGLGKAVLISNIGALSDTIHIGGYRPVVSSIRPPDDFVVVTHATEGGTPEILQARFVRGDAELGPWLELARASSTETALDAAVDCDGSSFVVAYTEPDPGTPAVDTVQHATLEPSDLTLRVTERDAFSSPGADFRALAVSGTRGTSSTGQRFVCAFEDHGGLASTRDVEATHYDSPGPGIRHCIAAPNSVGPGANLYAHGDVSIERNQFGLSVVACPPGAPGMFVIGAQPALQPFGAGYLCATGPTLRIPPFVTTDGAGTAALALDFGQPYGNLVNPGPPSVHYQFWYRDPNGAPPGFNLSDALAVEHTP